MVKLFKAVVEIYIPKQYITLYVVLDLIVNIMHKI